MLAARRLSSLEAVAGSLPVWRGEELARPGRVIASGHAALDAELPGGGWPQDGMVELLQSRSDGPFWQLLLPALAQALATQPGPVVLVGPPHPPFVPALAAQGLPGERLLWLRAGRPAERLWATEQALRCGEVAAVLAWLPQARDAELRRLQLAGQEQGRLLFVLRDAHDARAGSPARLRLALAPVQGRLEVRILKRRGPPLDRPVVLRLHASAVEALLATRGGSAAGAAPAADRAVAPVVRVLRPSLPRESHALDRTVPAR